MTSSTSTTTQPAAPGHASTQRGGLPGSPNPDVHAAVLIDLYRHSAHGSGDPAEQRRQARSLGVAFFVFFTCILGGISLTLNGLFPISRTVVSFRTDPTCGLPAWAKRGEHEEPLLDPAATFTAEAAPGSSPAVTALPPDAPKSVERYQVRVYVDNKKAGVLELAVPPTDVHGPIAHIQARAADGTTAELPLMPGYRHAWEVARLAKLVPTKYVMGVGMFMGLLGLLVPAALVPFYGFWMRYVAAPLGWFNTRLILGIVFFLFLTPMAILGRIFGNDRLRTQPLPAGESYWRKRREQRRHDHFERTF